VESTLGEGSTFNFTACFRLSSDEKSEDVDLDHKIRGASVLVVDDNASVLQIMKELLENWRMTPLLAKNSEVAMEIIKSTPSIDVIIVDSEIPGEDSSEFVRWINEQASVTAPIVLMLTRSLDRSRVDWKDIGINASLTKPVRASELLDVIMVTLGLQTAKIDLPAPKKERIPLIGNRPLNILVAEDTPFNQKFIGRLLDRWGINCEIAENGALAVTAHKTKSYDIILMDVQMPEMDGFEATMAIRKMEEGNSRHTPIIAMTAHAMKGDRERCIEAGMDDYVSKPISSDILREAILNLINVSSNAENEDIPEIANPEDENVILNEEALLDAFDNDMDFFKEALEMFISDYPSMMDSIRQAVESKDATALKRTAHALKGMVGNFQSKAAAQSALELEEMGRSEALTGAEKSMENLTMEIEALKNHLSAIADK